MSWRTCEIASERPIACGAVEIRELSVPDAYAIHPKQFRDDRGVFLEWYRYEKFAEVVGHPLALAQANWSVSRRGTVRGIHYADVPPSQAKYVTCVSGCVLDVILDIRVGSPTFGKWEAVRLDAEERSAVYLSEGLGHAFVALTDDATVVYLCNEVYNPEGEHGLNPLDPALGIDWAAADVLAARDPGTATALEPLLSEKDAAAPTLAAAADAGALPRYEHCLAWYAERRTAAGIG